MRPLGNYYGSSKVPDDEHLDQNGSSVKKKVLTFEPLEEKLTGIDCFVTQRAKNYDILR